VRTTRRYFSFGNGCDDVAGLHLDDFEVELGDLIEPTGLAFTAAEHLAASAVMVNDHTAFRVDWMPFAGRRQSGYGVGGIPDTMREMTEEKMIVFRM